MTAIDRHEWIVFAQFQDLNTIVVSGWIILLLVLISGVVIWRMMFSKSTDYGTKFDESVHSNSEQNSGSLQSNIPLDRKKTFASADTVTNNADEDIVEILERKLSKQKTVEVTGDPSISTDDNQELEKNFSNSPTVDATGDISVSFEEEE